MAATPYATTQWRKLRPTIYERDGGRCQMCGDAVPPTLYDVDHVIPWDEGGAWFDPANLRTACQPCNRGRGSQRMARMAKINRATSPTSSRAW